MSGRFGKMALDANEDLQKYVGKLVKFKTKTLHGEGTAAGMVKRVLPNGKLEIKAQLGGYYELSPNELV